MLKLLETITRLHLQTDIEYDVMDIGCTLTNITTEQCDDLSAMIECLKKRKCSALNILGNVTHDLQGLKREILEGPCGFSPRSKDYATHIPR